jgi:hypothetical protein
MTYPSIATSLSDVSAQRVIRPAQHKADERDFVWAMAERDSARGECQRIQTNFREKLARFKQWHELEATLTNLRRESAIIRRATKLTVRKILDLPDDQRREEIAHLYETPQKWEDPDTALKC